MNYLPTKTIWFKKTLFIAMVMLLFMTMSGSITASSDGSAPFSAFAFPDHSHQGTLKPGEQHWFRIRPLTLPRGVQFQQLLTLFVTPGDGNKLTFINMRIFEADQARAFYFGDANKMRHFGAGERVERDDNPNTGEFLWNGQLFDNDTYFIQVLNGSDIQIDYWLFNGDIEEYLLGGPEIQIPGPPPPLGSDPGNPEPLPASLARGTLKPGQSYWYSFSHIDFSGRVPEKEFIFTMFFTPDDGNRRHRINFELFAASEYEIWRRGDRDDITNFGAGQLVARDGDGNTGERLWRGWVLSNSVQLMRVENGSDVEIEYWIYDVDLYNPELGPKPAPVPARQFEAGASPQTAIPLEFGVNRGKLNPSQEFWYRFFITDFDSEAFEQMALTMVTTPDDGNRLWFMTFDVFLAGAVRDWSPGDNTQIVNFGAGSVVERDDNPLTGERIWKGWIIDNDLYYVQLRNGADVPMDYWLFTGDVYNPELGEKTPPVPRANDTPGTTPRAPLPLTVGVNQGRLGPNQEHWYTFSRGDVDDVGNIETRFTMVFTPDDGYRRHRVNFALFENRELRDWAPDNRLNIKNFGQGELIERDGNPETGEFIWRGHVIAQDVYYMRVSNESDTVIDYRIFPDDVIHANLD